MEKVAKTIASQKMSTSKLNLKVQNFYIQFFCSKHLHLATFENKPCLETTYLGGHVKNLQKKLPTMSSFLTTFPKNSPGPLKSSPNSQIMPNLVTLLNLETPNFPNFSYKSVIRFTDFKLKPILFNKIQRQILEKVFNLQQRFY